MAGQDPGSIQKEIEQTRLELAETIDAIADRISPKRMASRSAARVKEAVGSVLGQEPTATPAGGEHGVPTAQLRELAGEGAGAAYTGAGTYAVERRLRADRVLIAVGVAAAVTAAVVLWRRRR